MKLKVTVVLVILFAGFVVVTAGVPNALVTATMNTPTPTHNILLGTRSPEDVERGFPSPVPTLPPPTDLAPERPANEKFLLVFRTEDRATITFLAPYEMIEEQIQKIGREFLVSVIDPHFHAPREPDRELEELQTAITTLTPAPATSEPAPVTPAP